MKKAPSFLFLFSFLFASIISVAQNSILAGKITDENNNPVANAIINLRDSHNHFISAKTDSDGLYYTSKTLAKGSYSIAITKDDKTGAGRVAITTDIKNKKFYNFRLSGSKVTTEVTAKDPFMAAKLASIEAEYPYDATQSSMRMITDSTGKVIRVYSHFAPSSIR